MLQSQPASAAPEQATTDDASESGALTVQRTQTAGTEMVPEPHHLLPQRSSLARSDVSVTSRVSQPELHTSKVHLSLRHSATAVIPIDSMPRLCETEGAPILCSYVSCNLSDQVHLSALQALAKSAFTWAAGAS